jgi:uncharacterized membrane protein YdjX (TVP38/TMEM64 family)
LSKLLGALLAIAAAAAVVLAVEPLRTAVSHALHGDVDALVDQLRGLGFWGAVVLVALILIHSVVFFPAELPNAAAGLVFGFWVAFPMVWLAWIASGLIAYCLGMAMGRPIAVRLAGEQRVAGAEDMIGRGGPGVLVLSRLVPFVPFSLVGYIAGAARVPLWRYTWTSAVGVLPITAAATYVGHALDDFSASDPMLWVAVGTIAALAALTVVLARHGRRASR